MKPVGRWRLYLTVLASVCRQLNAFGWSYNYANAFHKKRFQDHRVSGIPAFDQHSVSWHFTHHAVLPDITHCTWDNNNIDCFHIALFSALEQTHCPHAASGSEWATAISSFIKKEKKKKRSWASFLISTEVVYWQHHLVFAWLMLRKTGAVSMQTHVHHTPMHQFTVSLHSKPRR